MHNAQTAGTTPAPRQRLRAPAAAAYLGLSPSTLAKLRCAGGGPAFTKLGRVVVYERYDLDAWVDAQGKRHSTSEPTPEPEAVHVVVSR